MPAPKDPEKRKLWIERSIKSRTGLKRSDETKKKMSKSAFKRNTDEYLQKLKDSHPKNTNSKLWDNLCNDQRDRMLGDKNPLWIGGYYGYWAVELKKIYKDCCLCHSDYKLEMHHKDKDPTNNDRTNLIILCRDCHRFLHRK